MAIWHNGAGYIPYIENSIENTPELAEYIYGTDLETLNLGDIVQVSYFKKLCKVVKMGAVKNVVVSPLDDPDSTYIISSKFLKVYEGNPTTAEVLYGS